LNRSALESIRRVEPRLGVAALGWVSVMPLVHRLGRGEGLLLAVNLSIALTARPSFPTFLLQAVVSTLVLGLLYLLNDVVDSPADAHDPGKDRAFVAFCVANRAQLFLFLAAGHALTLLLALAFLGQRSAAAVAAVFAVNLGYSRVFKGVRGLDVPYVALWGALYALVPGVDLPLRTVGLVGVMTSICHVFQITRDREVDGGNGIRTSAAAGRWVAETQMAAACAVMAWLLHGLLGPLAAASAVLPLVVRRVLRSNQAAWLLSKAYYAVIWLLVLVVVHGGHGGHGP